jgi:hypothetical protein
MFDIYNSKLPSPTVTVVVESVNLFKNEGEGRAYAAAFDPNQPCIWTRVPVFVGGGGPEDYVYTPPIVGAQPPQGQVDNENERQVILIQRGEHTPGAVACLAHPQMQLEEQADKPSNTSDHDAKVSKQSFALRRAGVKALIDENGALVIDTKDSDVRVVRLQLPDNGRLRISRGGSAGGRLTLWHKLEEFIDGGFEVVSDDPSADNLLDLVNNMRNRILTNEENILFIAELLSAPVVNGQPVATPGEAAQLVPNSYVAEQDLAFPKVDDMNAAAIDISRDVG